MGRDQELEADRKNACDERSGGEVPPRTNIMASVASSGDARENDTIEAKVIEPTQN